MSQIDENEIIQNRKKSKRAKKKRSEIKVSTPDDFPLKKIKGKKKKVLKGRVHIYISDETLVKIDEKADELGLDRSPCIQMLLNIALNNPIVRQSSQKK